MKKTNTQNNIGLFIGIGTSIGISLGVAFGSVFDNLWVCNWIFWASNFTSSYCISRNYFSNGA